MAIRFKELARQGTALPRNFVVRPLFLLPYFSLTPIAMQLDFLSPNLRFSYHLPREDPIAQAGAFAQTLTTVGADRTHPHPIGVGGAAAAPRASAARGSVSGGLMRGLGLVLARADGLGRLMFVQGR
jgi:hypothetical protein